MAQEREVRRRALFAAVMTSAVVALDWLLKFLARQLDVEPIVPHAAGLGWAQLGLMVVIVLSAFTTVRAQAMNLPFLLGWSIAVGGAIGNFGELIAFGRVTNFIHLPVLQRDDWYASPADLAVWGGSAILAVGCLILMAQLGKEALWDSSSSQAATEKSP